MSTNLPVIASTEAILISPEGLEVANCYLQCQDIRAVAEELSIDALSHKMAMEHLAKQIELEKIRLGTEANSVKNQVNVQINEGLGGTKYGELITKLLEAQA